MDYGPRDMVVPVIRRPAVAGYFYPSNPVALSGQVDEFTRCDGPASAALAVIVPHGSFRHAGAVIGSTLARVEIPDRCIILGPSHTGSSIRWSMMVSGSYGTPLGEVPVDEGCAEALRERCPFLSPDAWAQPGEHAIEVLLPFLQRLGPADLSVVPLLTGSDDEEEFTQVGRALAAVIRLQESSILLIASSDLSHYQPQAQTAEQDRFLIDAITALDGPGLVRQVRERSIVMCGYGVVAALLEAAKRLGASQATLVRYGMSADAEGDPDSVIGYAGIVIR